MTYDKIGEYEREGGTHERVISRDPSCRTVGWEGELGTSVRVSS